MYSVPHNLLAEELLKDIPAVRDDRFVVLEYVEATPGPRNIEAVKRLAAAFAAK